MLQNQPLYRYFNGKRYTLSDKTLRYKYKDEAYKKASELRKKGLCVRVVQFKKKQDMPESHGWFRPFYIYTRKKKVRS